MQTKTMVAEPEIGQGGDAVVVRDLVKRYGKQVAVDGISFTIHQGEIFGLLGPNGAGKTTTLEMIEGLRQQDSGSITVLGMDTQSQRRQVQERIGIQLQATTLFPELTVRETIALFGGLYEHERPVSDLLAEVNLTDKAGSFPPLLSGGQRQRLALALALVNDPALVFLDEPTTGLDPQSRHLVWESVERLRQRGKTVVLTTHFMDEAQTLCDRIAIMECGRFIAQGTPAELIASLGASATIAYALADGAALSADDLRALPAVTDLHVEAGHGTIYTGDPEATLVALLRAANARGTALAQMQIHTPTLEDVFLKLTGRQLRD
jgi:ABC-2 type transport system ATP-binding protein